MHQTTFDQLGLIEPILKALQHEGYTHPTPIQAQSIPYLLEGRDLLGCAQTGTGKTAAFAIPMIQLMVNSQGGSQRGGRSPIRALILTPTRELAIQIDESFKAYGHHTNLRTTVIFGGVGQKPQTDALRRGVDILVATPGRLLDLMNQGYVNLKELEFFVLDEADRMLDMGFIHDVKKVIAAIPRQRQTLFFSATMPPEVQRLSASLLHNPVKVEVTPVSSTAETVEQEVFFVDKANKPQLLVHLLNTRDIKEALVFSRTKHGADKLVRIIEKAGIRAEAIHGNKAQNARQRALSNFKERKTRVLVATDIAARGIDIDSLSHVVNFDIPNVPETYVHRIGRTGRAGASGIAISLCDVDERVFLRDITKLIARQIPVVEDHPFPASGNASKPLPPEPPRGQGRQGGGRNSGGRSQGGRSGGNSGGSGQPKDFAALTAELINDLEGGGPKAKPASGASKTNSRRRWRGPRPGGGGGQR
ncbi:MAG: DEAD/DEAH box helicase [Flavobacteriales bacterium]|jgi:ATP-dependent RNA helicase RhlE|nr:DEAD/DEAH box helicase [Flavobacteriales bacterium]MCI1753869.1 DEAD/DEAH box helicase [Flavobacteriales bacterium]